MRTLHIDFEKKFENELKPIINFVKDNDDVFLGIRNNYVDLYVNGGCFLELSYNKNKSTVKGYINTRYFEKFPEKMPKTLKDINGKTINNIDDWMKILKELKETVSIFQSKNNKREKILQQKLVHEFNKNSKYFAYDIEYVIEGLVDYVFDSCHKRLENKKPKQLGRADIMLISIPHNNQIKIYFMEVKEGTNSFKGVLTNNSADNSAPAFGSGIVGHLKNSVEIINSARKKEPYISEYLKNKQFNIDENLLEEIKYFLKFYSKFGLIKNNNFANIDENEINKLTISNEPNSIELVFFLGNYNSKESFENYLGIGSSPSKFSVKALLDNKMKKDINLDYISYEKLFDFKVCKEKKGCNENGFNLEIEKYNTIYKEQLNNS